MVIQKRWEKKKEKKSVGQGCFLKKILNEFPILRSKKATRRLLRWMMIIHGRKSLYKKDIGRNSGTNNALTLVPPWFLDREKYNRENARFVVVVVCMYVSSSSSSSSI